MKNPVEVTRLIKQRAFEIGFDFVGVSPVGEFPQQQYYKRWLERGFNADMKYMERNTDRRMDVRNILPGAKSVISCAVNYNTAFPYSTEVREKGKGWISRYAWGSDYHEKIKSMIDDLGEYLVSVADSYIQKKTYVDTGPVLEKMYAHYAGVGWIGKNTCVINQNMGSWLFLSKIITDAELDYDSPAINRCGTCTRCLDACPTGALTEPYTLDARLCISYLTIENKGSIPFNLRERIGHNMFGCDICQDVCPWNRKAPATTENYFQPRSGLFHPDLNWLSSLGEEEFREVFKNSAVKRAKRRGLLRNVMVVAGNSGDERLVHAIEKCLHDKEPLVRKHAAWALWKLLGDSCKERLLRLLEEEECEDVREEISLILSKCEKKRS